MRLATSKGSINVINYVLSSLEINYKLLWQDPKGTRTFFELRLQDPMGVEVSILDVGYGVSQVLPIVIKSFFSRRKVILISSQNYTYTQNFKQIC